MLSKFLNKMKSIDIFGQQITLSFRQEDQYRTSLGGLSSLCIIGIVIVFFYSNIINFFGMNTVTSAVDTNFNDDPEEVKFSLDNFMFAVQIEQTNFTTNPYFNITLAQRYYLRDANGNQVKQDPIYIDMVPCTLNHFKPIFDQYNISIEEQFNQYSLSNFLCPNLSNANSHNLTIGGAYTSSKYSFLKFTVQTCQNSSNQSWHPTCKSQTDINDFLKTKDSFRFQLYTVDYLINSNEAHNYIKPYIAIDQFYSFIPDSMFVQSDIKFRSKQITTDEGILMYSSESTQTFTTRDQGDFRDQVSISKVNSGSYGAFYLMRSPFSYDITRTYMKLSELLSFLGGFAQFMVAILGIVIKFYNREHMLIELANDLYQFEVEKKKQNTETLNQLLISQQQSSRPKISKQLKSDTAIIVKGATIVLQNEINDQGEESNKINEIKQFESPQTSNVRQEICKQPFHIQTFLKFKDLIKSKLKISISLRIILSQILPFQVIQNDQCILFQKAMQFIYLISDQVYHEFDIQYIMGQLQEVIKFKKVLFNEEQKTLFNFSQKPKISLIKVKRNRQSTIIKSILNSSKEDIAQQQLFSDLVESYQKIKELDPEQMTVEQKELNKRLMTLLGAQLSLIIEEQLEIEAKEIQNNNKEDMASNR